MIEMRFDSRHKAFNVSLQLCGTMVDTPTELVSTTIDSPSELIAKPLDAVFQTRIGALDSRWAYGEIILRILGVNRNR
jgi:hypothetical protein